MVHKRVYLPIAEEGKTKKRNGDHSGKYVRWLPQGIHSIISHTREYVVVQLLSSRLKSLLPVINSMYQP